MLQKIYISKKRGSFKPATQINIQLVLSYKTVILNSHQPQFCFLV